jgi:iron complex outermembrane receptor protein
MDGTDDDLAEIKDHQNYHFFNPKAGAVYMLQRWGEIYASAGVVNREPLRADIKESLKGNAEHKIKPERLYDYELGYRVSQNIWSAAVNLYYMDYKNQMVQTGKLSSNGYKLMENVAESYRAGVELNGKYSPFQFLELQINATFSRNKINSYTAYYAIYDADWNPLPQQYSEYYDQTDISFSPSIISASGITLKPLQNLSISLMNKYVGKQYYDNTSTESRRLPAYWVSYLNVSNRYQLKKVGELELQFLINNLFNRQYIANAWTDADKIEDNGQITEERYSGFFPQAPRNFMLKIGIKFQ